MLQIRSHGKGDAKAFFKEIRRAASVGGLDRYGREGVEALSAATPTDTGETASAWSYRIESNPHGAVISFYNSNVENGVSVAILLQYGHATRNGGWVEGRDYINPALRPIFDKIAKDAWEGLRRI